MRLILLLIVFAVGFIPQLPRAEGSNPQAPGPSCTIPKVPDGADLVYFGMFKARAASTSVFGNPSAVAGVTDIQIETGDTPIYLVAASYSNMILRVSGDTERLVRVVNVGRKDMGFVGVEKDRVAWLEATDCGIRGWNPQVAGKGPGFSKGGEPADQLRYVEALAGRALDRQIIERSFGLVALPSGLALERESIEGLVAPDFDGPYGSVWSELLHSYPGGLIEIAPDDLASSEVARPFTPIRY